MNALLTGRQLSVEMMPSLTVTAILTVVDRPLVAGPCLMQSGSKRAGDVSSGGGGRWQRESACAVRAALPTVAAHGWCAVRRPAARSGAPSSAWGSLGRQRRLIAPQP